MENNGTEKIGLVIPTPSKCKTEMSSDRLLYWHWMCLWLGDLQISNCLNTLRPRQNGRHFPDDIFKWIFLNENVWISINISLKFVRRDPINNIPTLVQIMAWRLPGDKPLPEPMMVRLSTHICVTRPQWVKTVIVTNVRYTLSVYMIRIECDYSYFRCLSPCNFVIISSLLCIV